MTKLFRTVAINKIILWCLARYSINKTVAKRKITYIIATVILAATALIWGCKKTDETATITDDRLNRPYCNDPLAINYNWDFPGTPDNTKCFYPIDIFGGTYKFTDSIYDADYQPDTVLSYALQLFSINGSKVKIGIKGFCANETLTLTADRFYKAYLDSLSAVVNGFDTKLAGQLSCRKVDTISGYIQKSKTDSSKLSIYFTIASDTGISYHKGTAIKQ